MSAKIKKFELYRKIVSIEEFNDWHVNTNGGTLILKHDNPKIDEILKVVRRDKICAFKCIRENKKFVIMDTHPDKLVCFEATIIKIEQEHYTKNVHVTTDPYKRLILPRHYTDYSKLCSKLRINATCLFIITEDFHQLLDIGKLYNHDLSIEVLDIINIDSSNYEIKCKDVRNKRFICDLILNIGSAYKITYIKASESNLYRIIKSEILLS